MAWAKPTGAWAQAVEDEEAESGPIHVPVVKERDFPVLGNAREDADFPSLGAAATGKGAGGAAGGKKGKKGGKKVMSLADFVTKTEGPAPGTFVPSARAGTIGRRGFADDIMLNLPTFSRGKVEGEETTEDAALGGAFRGDRQGREDRPRRNAEDMGPSRADMANDWGAERKFVSGGGPSDHRGGGFGDRGNREGGFGRARSPGGERSPLEPSRADATDDWGSSRQFVPSAGGPARSGAGGPGPRRYEEPREPSRADTEQRWERGIGAGPTGFDDRGPRGGFEDRGPRGGFEDRGSRGGFEDRGSRGGFGGGDRSWGGGGSGYGNGWAAQRQAPRGDSPPRSGSRERDNWRREGAESEPVADGTPAPLLTIPAGATRGSSRASVFGTARPREEVLADKGVTGEGAVEKLEAQLTAATERLEGLRAGDGEEPAADAIREAETEVEQLRGKLDMARIAVESEQAGEAATDATPAAVPRARGGSPAARDAEVDSKSNWRRESELPAAAPREERGRSGWSSVGHFRDRQRGSTVESSEQAGPENGEQAQPAAESHAQSQREPGRDRFWKSSNRGAPAPQRAGAGGGW